MAPFNRSSVHQEPAFQRPQWIPGLETRGYYRRRPWTATRHRLHRL